MAKLTKVTELAASLNMDAQQLYEQINALGLGFTVKTKASGLNEDQILAIKQALAVKRQNRGTTAIDAKSQSKATSGTVRIRRRRGGDGESGDAAASEQKTDTVAKSGASAVKADVKSESKSGAAVQNDVATKAAAEKNVVEGEVKSGETTEKSDAKGEKVASLPEVNEKPSVGAPSDVAADAASAPSETADGDGTGEVVVAAEVKETQDVKEVPQAKETDDVAAAASVGDSAEASKVERVEKSEPSKDAAAQSKLEKEKKAAKKAEKEKRKKEQLIELAPKFEKTVNLSFGSSGFADQVPDSFAVEVEDAIEMSEEDDEKSTMTDDAETKRRVKQGRKPASQAHDNDEIGLDGGDEEDARPTHKKSSRPSNITGTIDPALIRAMLVKDNKKFGNTSNDKNNRKPSGRTVVNSSQFYGGQNANANKNNANHSGTNYKKVKRNAKQTPAERAAAHPQVSEHKRVLKIADSIAVGALANDLGVKANEVIRFLMKELGMMVTVNQTVDVETAELVAAEYGFTVQDISFNEESFTSSKADKPEDMELRAPIVTVMGHVDHGKTSLLDAIRESRVTATEAGGITQHIGASTIQTSTGKVVFLDTPGHEAFTALRARGSKVTDLVVLVVAADDGVMPQTVEAINHAKAAGVPIIVAINKIDKPGANPERVRQALTEYELISEEWGGTTIFKEVSAKTGEGVAELLELIQLQSEVLELKANPDKPARGFILEAYKDTRRGTVASILVQEGTLHINDILVSGACYGKVKSMIDDSGKTIREAEPSTPVEITGLSDVPDAGEPFFVAETEKIAKEFTTQIKERKRNAELSSRKFDPWAQFKDNKILNVIIKADVQGSLEALTKSLSALSTEDVELSIVHAAVGGATENDVQLAIASSAIIVGFNTRPDARAADIAKREGVVMESFSVIYDIIDYVKDAMSGLLDPIIGENILGHTEIRNTFNVPKVGTIAGGYVTDGLIRRGAKCRLLRSGKIIYDSKIASLKRFKDDAKEVRSGFECGFSIENYNDVKVGDVVEVYEVTETKQAL